MIDSFVSWREVAGDVFPGPYEQTTDEQRANSIKSKGMGQINLVRAALPFIADKGSFTLVSGVLTDEYMHGGTIGTTINHLVEGFVKASAVELPRGVRINCVSPTLLAESVGYHEYFTGFAPVPARGSRTGISACDFDPPFGLWLDSCRRGHPHALECDFHLPPRLLASARH
jgi:NAD(P)-dependent dehydrogenase (short-subunit alcohol dehydrogenase family)